MKLRETTKQIIALLEQKSGYLVHVRRPEDPNLPTISTIIIARGNLPAHIISYKPGLKNESPDYSIIFQCARETKGGEELADLRFPHEKRKIICAQKHFKSVGIDYRVLSPKSFPEWWKLQSELATQDKFDQQ